MKRSTTTKESDIQRDVLAYLKARNILHFRTPNITFRRRRHIVKTGVSDIIILHNSKFIAAEIKKPKGILSEKQKQFNQEVIHNGGFSIIAYSLNDFIEKFNAIDNHRISN